MSANLVKRRQTCPYWSSDVKKCQISGGGLFIPQDDHSDIYCTSSEYPQCLQYVLYSEKRLEIVDKKNNSFKNRRRFNRISAIHRIMVDKVLTSGESIVTLKSVAKTLDLGVGGIRVALEFPLEHQAMVQIYFDDSFPEHLQSTAGQVSWCNKQIDEPGYQAGICFKSDRVIKAMVNHLRR